MMFQASSRPTVRFIALAACLYSAFATAQPTAGYPAKPVRIIAPFAAGGATDVLTRLIAAELQQESRVLRAWSPEARPVENSPARTRLLALFAPRFPPRLPDPPLARMTSCRPATTALES